MSHSFIKGTSLLREDTPARYEQSMACIYCMAIPEIYFNKKCYEVFSTMLV